MISAVELKKHVTSANILGIIIDKFYQRKKLCLIILLNVNKDLEIYFHYAILLFGLIVRLCVEGDKESPLDIKEIT